MNTVENVKIDILRECREQLALGVDNVKKRVASIEKIEAGEKKPTYKQLQTLAQLYKVPDWVFISEQLPDRFKLQASPSFRTLSQQAGVDTHEVRLLIKQVESLRELILDFRGDMGEPVAAWQPPRISNDSANMAAKVRDWLGMEANQSYDFDSIRSKIESQNIFVFLTSKHRGWSHVPMEKFRGLAIHNELLPIIIVNDSDAQKAQSFTLCHELGHLLQKRSSLDAADVDNDEERWCDQLAGSILMPKEAFLNVANAARINSLKDLDALARKFQVSSHACLVRLRQLGKISQRQHADLRDAILERIQQLQAQPTGSAARKRHEEIFRQYGRLYTHAVWQAYHDKEIGLHKLCKLLELKQAAYALKMKDLLQ